MYIVSDSNVYYNHLKGLLKANCQASPQVSHSVSLGDSLRIFTSHKAPGADEATRPPSSSVPLQARE